MTPAAGLGRAVARAGLFSAALTGVVSLAVAAGGASAPPDPAPLTPPTPAATPAAVLRVDELVADHGCWTGAAPDPTVIPGSAVVTLPGREPALVPADIGFEIWLEGRPGTVHAFCP
jgi:hypothetical protein